jgi:hypothetical protein
MREGGAEEAREGPNRKKKRQCELMPSRERVRQNREGVRFDRKNLELNRENAMPNGEKVGLNKETKRLTRRKIGPKSEGGVEYIGVRPSHGPNVGPKREKVGKQDDGAKQGVRGAKQRDGRAEQARVGPNREMMRWNREKVGPNSENVGPDRKKRA